MLEHKPAAMPTMKRAATMKYLRGCGRAPTEAYRLKPNTFMRPAERHKKTNIFLFF